MATPLPPPLSESPAVEALHATDIPALHALAASVGWELTTHALQSLLDAGAIFGHRAPDGAVVSSAAIVVYGDALASISIVMVHRAWQRRGLGEAVVRRCFSALQRPDAPVMLVSTSAGARLYERLGFRAVDRVHRLVARGPLRLPAARAHRAVPLAEVGAAALLRLDAQVFGADRGEVLRARLAQARSSAALVAENGALVGYGIGADRLGTLAAGPLVAPDATLAAAVLASVAGAVGGPIRVDVPGEQRAFRDLVRAHGFEETVVEPLMLLNSDRLPGRRERLFALASMALG